MGGPGSYGEVLRNRPFRSFALLNTLFIAVSIAPFAEFLPVFAKNESAVSERSIGFIFFVNTALIVLAQVPIVKWQEGKRRMRALAVMGVLWAASWLVVGAAGAWTTGTPAVAVTWPACSSSRSASASTAPSRGRWSPTWQIPH
ncbi:MAG: hypothetical protein ABR583_03210 [Gaiellaceae bacterium]